MGLSILVTNLPPATDGDVSEALTQLFQDYARTGDGQVYPIFRHQAEVFRLVDADREVFLVAGTAAGKTLAIAVPLFHKLATGRIRKVLLMYPTIALMEDQCRVMDKLAELTRLDVGRLRGGMSRTELIAALNKPVIVATPDEVYWFFRKNVKYSGLLIYGLALVDELVLDEAHLFNGLMLRNFQHLWQRMRTLASCLGKAPRLHILTATPTDALRQLNQAVRVDGKSKCHDVNVEFRLRAPSEKRAGQFVSTVDEVLDAEHSKVLVVCNSARMAHQLFESQSVRKFKAEQSSMIPIGHRLRFGKVTLGDLNVWLERAGVEKELVDELNTRLVREEDVILADLPDGTALNLPLQDIVTHATEVLERQCWRVKHALWERYQQPGETWESVLNNRPLPCRIIAAVRNRLMQASNLEEQQTIVDEWLTDTLERLSNVSDDPVHCRASGFTALAGAFVSVGLDKQLASLLTSRLVFEMRADPAQLPVRGLSRRPVYLRWLERIVGGDKGDRVREVVKAGLESGDLNVECRHVGLWKGSDVPVIVYSGSMAKQAREGLINVFSDLERAVLISTSAVEVGVDFHADTLVTEECEGNSFLQRFGRVGRHGPGGMVIAFVGGDVYGELDEIARAKMAREEFSTKIARLLPRRNYAADSELLDASHYLINAQLGRVGERLNCAADLTRVKPMAEELRSAGVQLGFGLRSTMPQVTLRDGVTKDPFYLLRYVDDQDLRPSSSSFELARAKTWFTSLVFERARFDVIVDLDETLKASRHAFIWAGDRFRVWSHPAAGIAYLHRMCDHFRGVGGWDKWHEGNFILLHGDVYLSRIDRKVPHPEIVRDTEQNPLFIPSQTYLVLWGWTDAGETRTLLESAKVSDWEELHYDWDRLVQDWDAKAMVILENAAGACFAAYRELRGYAGRQVQE